MSNRSEQRKLNQKVQQELNFEGLLEIKHTRKVNKARRIKKIKTDDDKAYHDWLNEHEKPKKA